MAQKGYDAHMVMYIGTRTYDVSLDREFQKHLSRVSHKHEVIDQGKCKKQASKINWLEREYNVQEEADVYHKDVKMFCNKNHFPTIEFCVPHTKQYGVRGFSNHYHMIFDLKL